MVVRVRVGERGWEKAVLRDSTYTGIMDRQGPSGIDEDCCGE